MSRMVLELAPTTFRTLITICKQDIRRICSNTGSIFAILNFFLLSASIFQIASGNVEVSAQVNVAILLICIVFSMMLIGNEIITDSLTSCELELLYLTAVPLEMILLTKYIVHSLFYICVYLLVLPILLILSSINMSHLCNFGVISIVLILYSNLIIMFSSSISIGGRVKFIGHLIVFPFVIPAVLLCTLSFSFSYYIWLVIAILIVLLPIVILISKEAIKISFEYL